MKSGTFELLHLRDGVVQSNEYGGGFKETQLSEHLLTQIGGICASGSPPQAMALYGSCEADFQVEALEQYDLEIIYPSHAATSGGLPETDPDTAVPAVGAAMACLGKMLVETNLLPPRNGRWLNCPGFPLAPFC